MAPGRAMARGVASFLLFVSLLLGRPAATAAGTRAGAVRRGPGICAMYGVCGEKDPELGGGHLNCVSDVDAQPLDAAPSARLQALCPDLWASASRPGGRVCCSAEQLQALESQVAAGVQFLAACPACARNFLDFFCALSCSPDQSLFVNVTAVSAATTTHAPADRLATAIDFFVDPVLGERLYASCAEVQFAAVNQKAMAFVGGGATDYRQWFAFLGLDKARRDPHQGSPFQINFPVETPSPAIRPLNASMRGCGDAPLACACADCPAASGCAAPPPPPAPPSSAGCPSLGTTAGLNCTDWTLMLVYVGVCGVAATAVAVWESRRRSSHEWPTALERPLLTGESQDDNEGDRGVADGTDEGDAEPHDGEDKGGTREVGAGPSTAAPVPPETGRRPVLPWAERHLRSIFYRHGLACASRPLVTIAAAVTVAGVLCLGCVHLTVVTQPEALWVAPGSRAARERSAYGASFGPFYRVAQLVLSTRDGGPAVTPESISALFRIQAAVDALVVSTPGGGASLSSLCYRPLGGPCATQSLLQYWQMDPSRYEDAVFDGAKSPEWCVAHWTLDCYADYGAPVDPAIVLGGYPRPPSPLPAGGITAAATALVVTYPLQADGGAAATAAAAAWEAAFVTLARNVLSPTAATAGLRLSYSTESSVESEIGRESGADAPTVAASYGLMFVYMTAAMGDWHGLSWSTLVGHSPRGGGGIFRAVITLARRSRGALGLGGVSLVLLAVGASIGAAGLVGAPASLIVLEALPFLALAIGVDNMCLLVHAYDRRRRAAASRSATEPVPESVANALADAGPGLTLAATAEAVAFALGAAASPMPACRAFALCAAAAVAAGYGLCITAFVAMMSWDGSRAQAGRLDCLPCLPGDTTAEPPAPAEDVGDARPYPPVWYHPRSLLSHRWLRAAVLAAFGALALWSMLSATRLPVGLDPAVALPRDSYLQGYLSNATTLLRVGPPVFFVASAVDVTDSGAVDAVCATAGCDPHSLLNRIQAASRDVAVTRIATPATSWLDDWWAWGDPRLAGCCRRWPNATLPRGYCPPPDQPPCVGPSGAPTGACDACVPCFTRGGDGPWALDPRGRPTADAARATLPWFVAALPSPACAKGGRGAYSRAVDLRPLAVSAGDVAPVTGAFMAYHAPLATQADFIAALAAARAVSDGRGTGGARVAGYAYSPFHVFFEQYLTIRGDAVRALGAAVASVFFVASAFLGWWAAAVVATTAASIVVCVAGAMGPLGVQLNGVSLVNLVMSAGVAVEFAAHVVRAFALARGARPARAAAALESVGWSVLSGITLTKLVGVVVLAGARTAIFEVYYFRMYAALLVAGAAHGLILLPTLLAVVGPPEMPLQEEEDRGGERGGEEGGEEE